MANFSALENLVIKMGATPIKWQSGTQIIERTINLDNPLEVRLSDVVSENASGLLTYNNQQVLLYIKDSHRPIDVVKYEPKRAPKVHFMDCTTMKKMREAGRAERYVVTDRKDGIFLVNTQEDRSDANTITEDVEAKLHVCRNCLKEHDYKNYSSIGREEQNQLVKSFHFKEFFEDSKTYFSSLPRYTDKNAPVNAYSGDWKEISRKVRERDKWKCSECRVDLSSKKYLLHVHHKNGVRNDNKPSNLMSLCADCHSKEPMHSHVFLSQKDRDAIQALRNSE